MGPLLVAATEQGLVRVAYEREDHDQVLQTLATGQPADPARARPARRGRPSTGGLLRRLPAIFDLPVDLRLSPGFRRQVLDHLRTIGYGHTESYAAVAAAAGRPRAVRAVGSACATNPMPVVVPCHRVLRSDGTLGGYIGGLGAKRTLLELER